MMNDTALRQMAAVNATVCSGNNISRYGYMAILLGSGFLKGGDG
jgi:hypothetical protein